MKAPHQHGRSQKARGFTLIELLVVIAIIGVLSTVVLASLAIARQKSRDARRLSDMHELQSAFELYDNDHGQYPDNPASSVCATCIQPDSWNSGADIASYIPTIPTDPTYTGTGGYRYNVASDKQSYTMIMHLERTNNWCSFGTAPGYSGWNNSDGSHYPPCN